jgi:hypothetical protein
MIFSNKAWFLIIYIQWCPVKLSRFLPLVEMSRRSGLFKGVGAWGCLNTHKPVLINKSYARMDPTITRMISFKHPDESGCWSHGGGSEIKMAGIVAMR